MPKAILDISQYDGGMNNHNNPRDLEENELSLLQNLSISNKGLIKTSYKESTGVAGSIAVDPPDGSSLWSFTTDYKDDGTEESTEHLILASQRYIKRLGDSGWGTVIDLSNAAPVTDHSGLVLYDGQIRFCDGDLNIDGNGQPSTETRMYYQFNRKYFNASATTHELSSTTSSSIFKPDNGQVGFNASVDVTTGLRGYLGLRVNTKEDTVYQTVTHGTGYDSQAGAGAWQSETSSNKVMEIGEATISDSLIYDTYGSSMSPTSSNAVINVASSSISGSDWTIVLDQTEEGFYLPLTIGDEFRSANYGSTSTRRIALSCQVSDIAKVGTSGGDVANNWAGINSNLTYAVEKYDGTTDTWSAVSIDSQSTSGTNSATKNLKIVNADDSVFRMKITVDSFPEGVTGFTLKVKGGHIRADLFPEDGNNHMRQTKSTDSSYDYHRTEWNDVIDSDNLIESNMLSMKIAIPYDYPNTKEIRVRLSQNTGNLDQAFIYTLSNSWVINARNKGWQEVLIPLGSMLTEAGSPTLSSCKHLRISTISSANGTEARAYFDDVKVIKDERGTWDGDYKFFYSWIYDRAQESGFFEFPNQGSGISLLSKRITAQAFIRELDGSAGFKNGGKRVTGANVYFAEYDKTTQSLKYEDPFFLMKVDLERGASHPNGNLLNIWENSGDHKTHGVIEYIDPPYISSFSINSGYSYNPTDHIEKIRFRDATVMNRRIYYGNVDLLYEKQSGETYPLREKYPDRVYKSLANKPDIVPSFNYIDVVSNDGDEVTALESYADRLLVFKKGSMLLVNATKDMEFLEDTFTFKGVWAYSAVTRTDKGIAWVNEYGAYFYDGENVVELTDKKIDQATWSTKIGGKPSIVYEPKNRHLIVSSTGNEGSGWLCDLNSIAWSQLEGFKTSDSTNMVIYDNNIQYGVYGDHDSDGSTPNRVYFKKITFDKSATASNNPIIKFTTRDITFGSSGQQVDMKKVYVTYTGIPGSLDIRYRTDGESTNKEFSSTATSKNDDSNNWGTVDAATLKTAVFIPNVKSDAKAKHSIKLLFNDTGATDVGMNFAIHDISIVYRGRKVK